MQSLPLLLRLVFAHLIADVAFSRILAWREQCGRSPASSLHIPRRRLAAGRVGLSPGGGDGTLYGSSRSSGPYMSGSKPYFPEEERRLGALSSATSAYAVLLAGSWMAIAHIGPARLARVLIQSFGGRGFWAVVVALVLVVWPVGQLIGLLTDPWRRRIDEASRQGPGERRTVDRAAGEGVDPDRGPDRTLRDDRLPRRGEIDPAGSPMCEAPTRVKRPNTSSSGPC